jgi:phosphate transport system substrate-binding protein
MTRWCDALSSLFRGLRRSAALPAQVLTCACALASPSAALGQSQPSNVPHGIAQPAGFPAQASAYALKVATSLPPYAPRTRVTGTLRLWGHGSPKHNFMGKVLRRWEAAFRRYQPGVRIVDEMYGTASAVGALYTGAGDLAILGEEISPAAKKAFERERHYAPTILAIATGSVDVNYYDYAHMVFVNRANPLKRITLPQLARILGSPAPPAHPGPIRRWGELGLTGAWADRRIQPYSWRFDQDFGLFLRERVLGGSGRINPHVRQFVTRTRPDGTIDDRGEQILRALARDPDGIAVSNSRFANRSVKLLELAATASGPYVLPSVATVISQQYPLTRIIPAVVDIPPGQPIDPAVREFLRFILSREGQLALVEDSGYLPLGPRFVRAELRALRGLSRCRRLAGHCRRLHRRETALQARELVSGPGHPVRGVIRVWGSTALQRLGQGWADRFRARHPRARVTFHMTGSDTGMAGLYTGEADVALLRRVATASELQAFEWVFRRPPRCIELPPIRAYFDSGPGAQPLTRAFLQSLPTGTARRARPCTPAR